MTTIWILSLIWAWVTALVIWVIFMKYLFTNAFDDLKCEEFFFSASLVACFWFVVFPCYFIMRITHWIKKKKKENKK